MPNPKKPSFEIDQQLLLNDSPEMVLLYAIRAIGSILDEQHEELAALRKEVEELKKSKINPNRFCFVEGCKDTELHAHAMPL